mmetsp:Transcript_18400/g.49029  ORF Transcript_18400/g.49029 Transcript_18400/m.49029 type:complete len:215 (+) Transcript_18400:412-1056(+)
MHLALEMHGFDNELPRLFLDRNELANVPVLELGPSYVEGDKSPSEVRSADLAISVVRANTASASVDWQLIPGLPPVEHHDNIVPCPLQALRELDGLCTELKLLAVHPDSKLLVDTSLEHIDTIVAIVVRKQSAVVSREFGTVPSRCDLKVQSPGGLVNAVEEGGASGVPGLAFHICDAIFDEKLTTALSKLVHNSMLSGAQRPHATDTESPEHC